MAISTACNEKPRHFAGVFLLTRSILAGGRNWYATRIALIDKGFDCIGA
jgi:hypothetical protein